MTYKNLVLSGKHSSISDLNDFILNGEWILRDLDSKKIKQKKIQVFESSSYKINNRINSYKIADEIYDSIKLDLANKLNTLHSKNFSLRFWQILFGYWLVNFIGICVERYFRIHEILEENEIKNILIRKHSNFNFSTNDTFGLNKNSINDDWENNIFYEIIKFFSVSKNLIIEDSSLNGFTKTFYDSNEKKQNNKDKIKNFLFNIFNKFTKKEVLISQTYLPKKFEFLLHLLFFQLPTIYPLHKISYKKKDENMRRKINLVKGEKKDLENFVRYLIPKCLPSSLVETFESLYKNCELIGYPKNSKTIFTSISYAYDENFKFYAAKSVEKGARYFIGQHGNEYFSHRFSTRIELETSDKFISWGYKNSKKIISSFNLKTLKKKRKFNDQGKLLIISHPSIHRVFSHNRYCDYKNAMLNSILLKEKIDKNISNQAMLRLDKEFKINEHSFNKKILNTFNANDLCFGESKLDKLIEKSRLCIFTYDSTGILENLSLNIPTLAIWKNFDNHLNDEFKEKYLLLKKGKIFFEDIDKLVKHINKYWNNISSWWFSKENQSFITKFNEDFNNKGNVKSLIKLKNEIKNYE